MGACQFCGRFDCVGRECQREAAKMFERIAESKSGEPNVQTTGENKSVRFHMLPEDSNSLREALGSVTVDADVVRDRLDHFLRAVIEERFVEFKMDERIKAQMDRRIEVAIKTVLARLESDVVAQASQWAKEKVREQIAAIPLRVRIDTGAVAT